MKNCGHYDSPGTETEVRGRRERGAERNEKGVPGPCHCPHHSRSRTGPGGNRLLIDNGQTHARGRGNRLSTEISRSRVGALTDILTPDPLFPACAIRQRYLALSKASDVESAQTVKRDRHSGIKTRRALSRTHVDKHPTERTGGKGKVDTPRGVHLD